MKVTKLIGLYLITGFVLMNLMTACGLFGAGPRDGKGPRRDGSGGGPCSWFSCVTEDRTDEPSELSRLEKTVFQTDPVKHQVA